MADVKTTGGTPVKGSPAKGSPANRPLSPHLQIYKMTLTMAMSVVHRGTGVALYGGTMVLALFLLATASGPASYAHAAWFFGSFIGKLFLFGYTWTLLHHMMGGIRHLIWDTGAGLDPVGRETIARATLIASVTLTVLVWFVVLVMK